MNLSSSYNQMSAPHDLQVVELVGNAEAIPISGLTNSEQFCTTLYMRAVPGTPDCIELNCVASLILLPGTYTLRSYENLCRRDLNMKLLRHESAKR
jgi:hypothetical protein